MMPMHHVSAGRVAPMHVAPYGRVWVQLIEEVIFALPPDRTVGVIHPIVLGEASGIRGEADPGQDLLAVVDVCITRFCFVHVCRNPVTVQPPRIFSMLRRSSAMRWILILRTMSRRAYEGCHDQDAADSPSKQFTFLQASIQANMRICMVASAGSVIESASAPCVQVTFSPEPSNSTFQPASRRLRAPSLASELLLYDLRGTPSRSRKQLLPLAVKRKSSAV